jgi:hypothetical protein
MSTPPTLRTTVRLPSLLVLTILLAVAPAAQAQRSAPPVLPVRVRLVLANVDGTRQLTGRLEGLTRDSLVVRVDTTGAVHHFARSDVRRLERSRPVSALKAAGVGCLMGGGLFGFLALGTSDESNVLLGGSAAVAAGFVAGCALGALVGALVGAGQGGWEPFDLPPPEPAPSAPPDEPL